MKLNDLCKRLVKLSLFSNFTAEDIEIFLNKCNYQLKTYKRNESIFFRGDNIDFVVILLEGSARGEMQNLNGDSITIDYIYPLQVIASAFIFGNNTIFPVDLISAEKSIFLFLNKKNFLELLQENSQLTLNFLNEISNKGQMLSKRIWFNFVNKTISDKLLSYIQENCKKDIIIFKPNISELAKRFEVTRPSLSREISIFCEKGILTKIQNNKYKVDFSKINT